MTHRAYAAGLLLLFTAASLASAQSWGPRGLDELKEETLRPWLLRQLGINP